MGTPTKLYHYTSLNTLALILSSRSIMFNRADKVNDKREGLSSDFGSFAQYLFISCWTETAKENMALWNIYTPKMRGVRIELPIPIFKIYKIDDIYDSIIPAEKIEDTDAKIFVLPHSDPIYKVEYTDDEDLLNPKIIKRVDKYEGFQLGEIGVRKKTLWQFENEWRYRLNIFPIDTTLDTVSFPDKYYTLLEEQTPPPISNYFIAIQEESFSQMKIKLGPRMEHGDKEIVTALISKYNPTASLQLSILEHDIR